MDSDPGIVIAVVGATGTGKSAAAVSLASQLGGEVINADAMQLYRGLIACVQISFVTHKISCRIGYCVSSYY